MVSNSTQGVAPKYTMRRDDELLPITLGRKDDIEPGGANIPRTTSIAMVHSATTAEMFRAPELFFRSSCNPVVS